MHEFCVCFCSRAALEKDDPTVKIRIFELLSAICVYSPEGYMRVIDVLEHYKVCVYDVTRHVQLFSGFVITVGHKRLLL